MTPMQEIDYKGQLRERDRRIEHLEQTVADLRQEADRLIQMRNQNYPEGPGTLLDQLLEAQARVVQLTGDLMDFHTVARNCSVIYDHVTSGRISNALTYPSVVIQEMEEVQQVEWEELFAARLEEQLERPSFTFEDLCQGNQELHTERFSAANGARLSEVYHPIDSWSPSDWSNAFAGEAGEAANLVKKMRRVTEDPAEYPLTKRLAIADEVADTVIYGDLLCQRLGVSLTAAIRRKFNRVAAHMGSLVRL